MQFAGHLELLNDINTISGGRDDKTEVIYDEPDFKPYRAKKDHDIELEECPAYGENKANQNVELKECPAYGIL